MRIEKNYLLINLILVKSAFLLAIIMQNHEHKGAYTGGEKKKGKKEVKKMKKSVDKGKSIWYNK